MTQPKSQVASILATMGYDSGPEQMMSGDDENLER
jgi:hypothetical protein